MAEERRNSLFGVDGIIYQFLCQKFLVWLEALSLMRQIHVAILVMNRLEEMTEAFYSLPIFELGKGVLLTFDNAESRLS